MYKGVNIIYVYIYFVYIKVSLGIESSSSLLPVNQSLQVSFTAHVFFVSKRERGSFKTFLCMTNGVCND